MPFALSRFSANFGVKILLVNLSCVTESCFFFCLSGNQATASTKGSTSDFAGKMKLHHPHLLYWAWLMFESGDSIKEEIFNRLSTLARFPFAVRYPIRRYRDENNHFWPCHICMTYANLPLNDSYSCSYRYLSLMKGQAWNVCWGTQAKTRHFCSLFFGNSLTYFIKDAFDWPYSGIRIRKIFVANLLVYRDFWATQTLHTSGYLISSRFLAIAMHWKAKQVISRVNSF